MKKFFLLAITAAVFSCASCKKDKAVIPDPVIPDKLLTKLTKKEDNTTTVFNFLYDGN
ncbi:MAG: hypothetical protein ABJC98_02125 [Bacteroidota bacterium]